MFVCKKANWGRARATLIDGTLIPKRACVYRSSTAVVEEIETISLRLRNARMRAVLLEVS